MSHPSSHTTGTTSSAHGRRVIVVGGGLAGIAAGVRLAEAGVAVTLVESRKRLGGRATSFTDPDTGEVLDNCQHVLMRSCTHLIDLYQRLGVADRIRWQRALYFAGRDGHIDTLEPDDVPAPLHMLRPLWRLENLTGQEKWAIAQGMLSILQVSRKGRDRYANESFADWLKSHRQPAGAIEKFWSLIITSACNESLDRVAANYAIQVFQEGFLYEDSASEMGLSTVPLVELYDSVERRLREAAGGAGEVLTGTSADSFEYYNGKVTALRLGEGKQLEADAYIAAVPFDRLAKMTSEGMAKADARLAHLNDFESSPILGIHLFLRRPDGAPVMSLPHLSLMQSPLHWIFNKGVGRRRRDDNGLPADRVQHLHGVISAAHDWVERSADDIRDMALAELRNVIPQARDAELVHARVIKEKRATFSITPGIDSIRPKTAGAIPNFYLAGDWVQTHWPATMEGATRSGYAAADAVLEQLGLEAAGEPIETMQPGLLYRLMSG
ncbi:hydroxysqualene dehydroxylase HpnE [Phycisphaerales bacterium AB-hyl4]|uniref:Hydroxysqualene dehydroxylase HpnE n=1 Tax=Natronomicrosphaera hydrolytica TaxID=3242702 RepID=A0ABV4U665_9BACT